MRVSLDPHTAVVSRTDTNPILQMRKLKSKAFKGISENLGEILLGFITQQQNSHNSFSVT